MCVEKSNFPVQPNSRPWLTKEDEGPEKQQGITCYSPSNKNDRKEIGWKKGKEKPDFKSWVK